MGEKEINMNGFFSGNIHENDKHILQAATSSLSNASKDLKDQMEELEKASNIDKNIKGQKK